jgi:ferredoxin-NADP reductase
VCPEIEEELAMPPAAQVAKVVSAEMITPTTIEVILEPPAKVPFQAGQYIIVDVARNEKGQPIRRSYSLSNAPEAGGPARLELCVKMVEGGVGGQYLRSLKMGDPVTYLGPLGKFVVGKQPAREYVFIATGTGLSPCLSILLEQLPKGDPTPMRLYWGLRDERDLYYHDRLQDLERRHPNLKITICLSQPKDGWSGPMGRVTRYVTEEVTPGEGAEFYMAGNGAMIEEVKKLLLERGAPKQAIKCDIFF